MSENICPKCNKKSIITHKGEKFCLNCGWEGKCEKQMTIPKTREEEFRDAWGC